MNAFHRYSLAAMKVLCTLRAPTPGPRPRILTGYSVPRRRILIGFARPRCRVLIAISCHLPAHFIAEAHRSADLLVADGRVPEDSDLNHVPSGTTYLRPSNATLWHSCINCSISSTNASVTSPSLGLRARQFARSDVACLG
jgi:hypothetical protein